MRVCVCVYVISFHFGASLVSDPKPFSNLHCIVEDVSCSLAPKFGAGMCRKNVKIQLQLGN